MPFNGSGTYGAPSLPGTWNPATSGSTMDPTDWNTLLTDISTALTNTICKDGQSTISANIPFATHRITGLGNPVGAQDAVTLSFLQATPWSYLGGLTTSRASATTLSVSAGFCVDSTNLIGISLASAMTKSTAGAWASGNNSNGMGQGLTIANTTWYHVFAIINTGVADIYFDTSVTAANKPTSTTAFRRVGSFLTNGSAQIISFIQDGDLFQWLAPVQDLNSNNPTTGSAVTRTLASVPTGVNVSASLQVVVNNASGAFSATCYLSDLATNDVAPTASLFTDTSTALAATGGVVTSAGRINVRTNTSAQIRTRITATGGASDASLTFTLNTLGWIDARGKNA